MRKKIIAVMLLVCLVSWTGCRRSAAADIPSAPTSLPAQTTTEPAEVPMTTEESTGATTEATTQPPQEPTEATTVATTQPTQESTEATTEVTQPETEPEGTDYVLNKNSKKFHYPDCGSVKQMKEANKEFYTGTRGDLIASGYTPCGNCDP